MLINLESKLHNGSADILELGYSRKNLYFPNPLFTNNSITH